MVYLSTSSVFWLTKDWSKVRRPKYLFATLPWRLPCEQARYPLTMEFQMAQPMTRVPTGEELKEIIQGPGDVEWRFVQG